MVSHLEHNSIHKALIFFSPSLIIHAQHQSSHLRLSASVTSGLIPLLQRRRQIRRRPRAHQ